MWRSLLSLPWSCLPLLANDAQVEAEAKFADARARMVTKQLASPARGIQDFTVLEAMRVVPRHEFVPEKSRDLAYADRPLSIGHGQTISQPYVVAFMTEQLAPGRTDRVLEIGTGSGYQAAVLSRLVADVYSIEIVAPLAESAAQVLQRLGYRNVHTRTGDGYLGWSEQAPFDAIIVTCAPDKIPLPLIEQLKEGGRMIIPVGSSGQQELVLLRKRAGQFEQEKVMAVRFVPMTGTAQEKSHAVTATAAPQKPAARRSREGRR